MADHTHNMPARAGEGTSAQLDDQFEELAPPIDNIQPRLPSWRSVMDIDDAVAECGTLAHTLDAACDILREMHYVRADGSRYSELDQIAALVSVSHGLAQYLTVAIDALPRTARSAA